MEQALRKSATDFGFFCRNFVYTLDEHDEDNPTKPIPMEKKYLSDLASIFQTERLLIIEKSRQMMVTWIGMAYCLWVGMFHEGRRVFVQSKKEKDADELINRAKFIYSHLPEYFKIRYRANEPMSYLTIKFGKHNSVIQGIPQGADVIRQYTLSLLWSDEMAFQEKAEEAFVSAKPALSGGGQFIGVSTPNFKEFFYRLRSDNTD